MKKVARLPHRQLDPGADELGCLSQQKRSLDRLASKMVYLLRTLRRFQSHSQTLKEPLHQVFNHNLMIISKITISKNR